MMTALTGNLRWQAGPKKDNRITDLQIVGLVYRLSRSKSAKSFRRSATVGLRLKGT